MDSNDWAHMIVTSNEAVMQWYSLITQKAQPPQPDVLYSPLPGGGSLSVGTQSGTLLIIGLVLIVALVLFKD